ncbi:PilW family protein [Lysobacter silvisoli]|uniref:Pilus assembly protein PilW n=1 Tax=Lysobacter silvisoli TaxID=2293254 RepID=A0A371K5M6_9GAMM|nr:PilW family protein [Lysobacter silvisoli]RDZ29251.1 pilus assembly protein PilW [Lysobacter silvisoli]
MNRAHVFRSHAAGFSMVELMVALALGTFLMIGLLQVFDASRITYKLSEGLARVQENSRFAMDYLQRDLRMAGHMGCVADQSRLLSLSNRGFRSAFAAQTWPTEAQLETTPEQLHFHTAIQGFEAANTAPGGALTLPAAATWSGSPALPAYVSALSPAPMAGSDVVVLRYFSAEGATVVSSLGNELSVETASWDGLVASGGVDAPGLFAVGNCQRAIPFQATSVARGGSRTTLTVAGAGLNRSDLTTETLEGSTLYRAESEVYYVALSPDGGEPTLYRARYTAAPGSGALGLVGGAPEPLVEGIENMQLIYGQDLQTSPDQPPTGYVARQNVAQAVQTGSDKRVWRRVGLVQVAFLSRSTERAGVVAQTAMPALQVLGVRVTPPADGRYRSVYESSVALRNRLYGN